MNALDWSAAARAFDPPPGDVRAGPSRRADVRLDGWAGDGRAGSGPDGGIRPEACGGLGRGGRRDVAAGGKAGCPTDATNSPASAGGPTDPPGVVAATASVPGRRTSEAPASRPPRALPHGPPKPIRAGLRG